MCPYKTKKTFCIIVFLISLFDMFIGIAPKWSLQQSAKVKSILYSISILSRVVYNWGEDPKWVFCPLRDIEFTLRIMKYHVELFKVIGRRMMMGEVHVLYHDYSIMHSYNMWIRNCVLSAFGVSNGFCTAVMNSVAHFLDIYLP